MVLRYAFDCEGFKAVQMAVEASTAYLILPRQLNPYLLFPSLGPKRSARSLTLPARTATFEAEEESSA
ncbi:hypothetical protein SIAM614_05653 [Stappia aggregata IAM 12614]|uniref:Uncharacterized protein n=1 Tax=Roseibium aggregatum (strain ATCC 25650 / DSM 13394 / JCM 20685 / NBRC 16684 / NCIMB 2208 / IAM 12614 / B1) TaxID=384765 RepID=A0NUX6_ROSAI|nr:hypothetical protein SIAM614_05653 [Stappia aggregata IAM 12614] [Roseibium aggregatum IAM 12614]